jgi:hypothetical protein
LFLGNCQFTLSIFFIQDIDSFGQGAKVIELGINMFMSKASCLSKNSELHLETTRLVSDRKSRSESDNDKGGRPNRPWRPGQYQWSDGSRNVSSMNRWCLCTRGQVRDMYPSQVSFKRPSRISGLEVSLMEDGDKLLSRRKVIRLLEAYQPIPLWRPIPTTQLQAFEHAVWFFEPT